MSKANDTLIDQYRAEFAEYARAGLEDFLHTVEGEARRLAPIRKVFKAGGRRQLAWRNVFESSATTKRGAEREYRAALGQRRSAKVNVQGLRVVTTNGKKTIQVRTYQQQEPYSSPARRAWTAVNERTYQRRQGSLINKDQDRESEPLLFVGGARHGQAYAFSNYDLLNYEGRRSLKRGMSAIETRGFEYVDTHHGGMVTVAGKETTLESPHVEAIPQINTKRERFGKQFGLQLGGALRKSIEMTPPEIEGRRVSGGVSANVRYALYVEFGTQHHGAAQPYLRPALMRYRYLLAKSVGSNVRNRRAS